MTVSFPGKRIGALTDFELPEVLFQTLTTVFTRDTSKESAVAEELIVLLHVVFSKMGTKGEFNDLLVAECNFTIICIESND